MHVRFWLVLFPASVSTSFLHHFQASSVLSKNREKLKFIIVRLDSDKFNGALTALHSQLNIHNNKVRNLIRMP